MQNDKTSHVRKCASQDFELAVETCLRHVKKTTDPIGNCLDLARSDVVEIFGGPNTELIFQRVLELENAYRSINPITSTGATLAEDVKSIREQFHLLFPNAPSSLIRNFENRYCRTNY